jgi:hypothetical protein
LTSISLPTSLTTLDSGSFSNCSALTSITIPEGVTTIPQGIFANCTSLTTVILPATVTTLSSGMFTGCTALTTLTLKSESPPAGISYLVTDISGSSASITISASADSAAWSNTLASEGYSGPINTETSNLLVSFNASTYSGSGAWNDDSGNGYNATLEAGTAAKNNDGNGIVLDGCTSWTFPDIGLQQTFSISVWFKLTAIPNPFTWLVTDVQGSGLGPNMMIQIDNTGNANCGFVTGGQGYTGNPLPLPLNEWHNINVTWDGTYIKTYYDGSLFNSIDKSGDVTENSSSSRYRIGADFFDSTYYTQGEIGALQIHSVALSSTEITSYYNSTVSTYPNA